MARMYSRKKGKSGSHRPVQKIASWVKYKPKEIEEIVVKLAKEGNTSARIGIVLRDQYGIPSVRMSKLRIAPIMKEHKLYPELPEDMFSLVKRAVILNNHLSKNKRDYISKRGLELTVSKIRRLAKHYKKDGTLPKGWKWDIEQSKLLVK